MYILDLMSGVFILSHLKKGFALLFQTRTISISLKKAGTEPCIYGVWDLRNWRKAWKQISKSNHHITEKNIKVSSWSVKDALIWLWPPLDLSASSTDVSILFL